MKMNFEKEYIKFWSEFGKGKKMVLSSSLNNIVTSRMMSIVYFEEKLYFQTDKLFRKYEQLKGNPHISLCIDNIQIEGKCKEVGKPKENINFCNIYKELFPNSFKNYSLLENERLFEVTPNFIQRWIYIDNIPYIEIFDIKNKKYILKEYFINNK